MRPLPRPVHDLGVLNSLAIAELPTGAGSGCLGHMYKMYKFSLGWTAAVYVELRNISK